MWMSLAMVVSNLFELCTVHMSGCSTCHFNHCWSWAHVGWWNLGWWRTERRVKHFDPEWCVTRTLNNSNKPYWFSSGKCWIRMKWKIQGDYCYEISSFALFGLVNPKSSANVLTTILMARHSGSNQHQNTCVLVRPLCGSKWDVVSWFYQRESGKREFNLVEGRIRAVWVKRTSVPCRLCWKHTRIQHFHLFPLDNNDYHHK